MLPYRVSKDTADLILVITKYSKITYGQGDADIKLIAKVISEIRIKWVISFSTRFS